MRGSRPLVAPAQTMDASPARSREMLAVLLVCFAGAALVFAPALFGTKSVLSFHPEHPSYPRPWVQPAQAEWPAINPITSDIDFFVLPGMLRAEQRGPADGWDQAQLLGYPARANLSHPEHSPLWQLALQLAEPVDALALALWWHTALAAALAWRAARWLGARSSACWIAAVGSALSAWMFTRWHLPQVACASIWWGGLVVGVERLRRSDRRGAIVEFGLWGGLALLSGFPQVALLLLIGAGTYALMFRSCRMLRSLLALVAGLALAVFVGAPDLNAVRVAYPDSARNAPATRAATVDQGLAPGALLGALVPDVFGSPPAFAEPEAPAPTMEAYLPRRLLLSEDIQDNVVENALYPGFLILLLLPLAWGAGRAARRLLWLAGGSVALALMFPWLAEWVPGVRALGGGSIKRVLVLWAMCLPLAAALGLEQLLAGRARPPRRAWWIGLVALGALACWPMFVDAAGVARWSAQLRASVFHAFAALSAGVAVLSMIPKGRRALVFVPLLLFVELGGRAWTFNPFPERHEPFPTTPGLALLATSPGRIATLGSDSLLPPTAAATHGLRFVHGVAPMVSARTAELLGCIEDGLYDLRDPRVVSPFRVVESLRHPLLDLLGVDRVVFDDPTLPEQLGLPLLGAFEAEGFGVLAREGALPRATALDAAVRIDDPEERLARLTDPAASWRSVVMLEAEHGLQLAETGALVHVPQLEASQPAEGSAVPQLSFDVAAVVVESDKLVRIHEAWDAGWSARLDGAPATLLRADHALMAVAVPAGSRRLELRYELPAAQFARGVSLAALALLGALALASLRSTTTRSVHADS